MDQSSINDAVAALQRRYAYALDRRNMEAWLACFADDGTYLCQTRESFDEGLPVAFMWDDKFSRLKDRVKAINEVWAGTAEDYQPRHFCFATRVGEVAGGTVEAVSNFTVFYTTNRGDSSILATGEYIDTIRLSGEGAQFTSKKAVLDQAVLPRYLVYPI